MWRLVGFQKVCNGQRDLQGLGERPIQALREEPLQDLRGWKALRVVYTYTCVRFLISIYTYMNLKLDIVCGGLFVFFSLLRAP